MNESGTAPLKRLADYVDTYASSSTPRAVASRVRRGKRISYAELKSRVDQFSKALIRKAACAKGDRVAMLCTPRPEFLVAFLATTAVGALWLGLNPRYRLREFLYVVGDSTPSVLLSLTQLDDRSYKSDIQCLIGENHCVHTVVSFRRNTQRHADLGAVSAVAWRGDFRRTIELGRRGCQSNGSGLNRLHVRNDGRTHGCGAFPLRSC